jgi:hypothetical protein
VVVAFILFNIKLTEIEMKKDLSTKFNELAKLGKLYNAMNDNVAFSMSAETQKVLV